MKQYLIITLWTALFVTVIIITDRFFFFKSPLDRWQRISNLKLLTKLHKRNVEPNFLPNDLTWPPTNIFACNKKDHSHFWYKLQSKSNAKQNIWIGNYTNTVPQIMASLSFCIGAHNNPKCPRGYKSFSKKLNEKDVITIITNIESHKSLLILKGIKIINN